MNPYIIFRLYVAEELRSQIGRVPRYYGIEEGDGKGDKKNNWEAEKVGQNSEHARQRPNNLSYPKPQHRIAAGVFAITWNTSAKLLI